MYFWDEPPSLPPLYTITGDANYRDNGNLLHPLPSYMGATFTLLCKFWSLGYEIVEKYYSDLQTPITTRIPLRFAETMYQNLLVWTRLLPHSIFSGKPQFHHVAVLQYVHWLLQSTLYIQLTATVSTFTPSPSSYSGPFRTSRMRSSIHSHIQRAAQNWCSKPR